VMGVVVVAVPLVVPAGWTTIAPPGPLGTSGCPL
jgi:hypothetical protein